MNTIKKIFLAASITSCAVVSNADNVYIEDFDITIGETKELEVYLDIDEGSSETFNIQAYFVFPEGLIPGELDEDNSDLTAALYKGSYNKETHTLGLGLVKTKAKRADTYTLAVIPVTATRSAISGSITIKDILVKSIDIAESSYKADVKLKIGAGGQSTYCNNIDVEFEGATVNYAKVNDTKTQVNYTEAGNCAPANTGVVLCGTEGALVKVSKASAAVEAPAAGTNDLVGALEATEFAEKEIWILATEGGNTAYYWYNGGTFPANMAYLPASVCPNPAKARFIGDTSNGIQQIIAEGKEFTYNLMGVRTNNKKGFVLENGNKTFKK